MAGFNKNLLAKMVLVAIGMDGALASFSSQHQLNTLKGVKRSNEAFAEAKATVQQGNKRYDNPTHDSGFLNKAGFASRRLAQRTSDQDRESHGPFQPAVLEDNNKFLGNQELPAFTDLKNGQDLSSQIPVEERSDENIGIQILDDEKKPVSFKPNQQLANDHQIDSGKSKQAFELPSLADITKDGYDEDDDEFIQATRVADLEQKLKWDLDSNERAAINNEIAAIKKQYTDKMLIAEAKAKKKAEYMKRKSKTSVKRVDGKMQKYEKPITPEQNLKEFNQEIQEFECVDGQLKIKQVEND